MEKISKNLITELVITTIDNYCLENQISINLSNKEETRLFGGGATLDSLSLVSLIVEIEEKIEDTFGVSLILADEKAMSRRTSPFSKISYLVDYIEELINLQK
jgi:acyl carrier protein